jgi:ribosomal protein S18 acetylase RimI-like enzyme
VIRRGGRGDVPFMKDMLRHAYYWRWGDPATADLPTSRYVDSWGRPGDAAMIALDDGISVGAAWYRLFTRAAPGYGFVDESVPELTIAVVPSRRGRGYGDELLEGLLERARQEGYPALSLSVEKANPALRLYERFGFRPVGEVGNSVVMKADLSAAAA